MSKRFVLTMACVLTTSWGAVTAAPAADQDADHDSAFEGQLVHHWDFNSQARTRQQWNSWSSPNTTADYEWSPDDGRGGSGALHTVAHGPKTALWQVGVPVVGGATYQISAWVKLEDAKGVTFLSARHRDGDGEWVSGGNFNSQNEDIFLRGTTEWRRLTMQFKAPSSADRAMIHLSNRYGEGDRIWFDDVELKEAVGPQLRRDGPRTAATIAGAVAQLGAMGREVSDDIAAQAEAYPQRVAERVASLDQSDAEIEVRRAAWALLSEGVQLQRRLQREAQHAAFASAHSDQSLATAWVSSMHRVFIDDLPMTDDHTAAGDIALYRGEQEAAQLVLVPFETQAGVSMRIVPAEGDRRSAGENALTPADIDWKVVGYVKIDKPAFNHRRTEPFPYSGWWPDPLLEKTSVPLEAGHYQPIWIQVDAPRDAAPGVYHFVVEVRRAGGEGEQAEVLARTPLRVEVWDGELPERWYMQKVMSFSTRLATDTPWSGAHKTYAGYDEQRWAELRDAFFQMLLDYRIGIATSLYESVGTYPPQWLKRAEAAGQNVFLTSAGHGRLDEDGAPYLSGKDQRRIADALGPTADMLEEHGLLGKTYYYAFDEQWPWMFDLATEVFQNAKHRGYRTMSTLHDESYGTDSTLGSVVDAFVDAQSHYDPDLAAESREQGNDVWVYTTMDFNIETDAIYHRMRPWKVMHLKADGYLIWAMNRWVGNDGPISNEIRSEWNPRLDGGTPHSSAMMIYPGEDGPVSCIRLENFRDGIEDYDLLAHTATQQQREGESAREAQVRLMRELQVPDEIDEVKARQVREVRRRLAERIASLDGQSD